MALADVLSARADNARATAQAECGSLGTVTLEALPLRDIERLSRGADADRAIFYAACRDLQRVGAELMRQGKVYRPDQVTALVRADEAAIAARRVRELSGWKDAPSGGEDGAQVLPEEGGQVSHESEVSEVRPEVVQEIAEVRHDTVQQDLTENAEIRHSFVQTSKKEIGDGQVSREFLTDKTDEIAKISREQVLWSETAQTPQNVGELDKTDGGLRNIAPVADNKSAKQWRKKSNRAHESKSEFGAETGGALHESTSELTGAEVDLMHEITSELTGGLHEIESEKAEMLHEDKSDFRRGRVRKLHESESDYAEKVHESTSELAERVARELLDGLRHAAWVR